MESVVACPMMDGQLLAWGQKAVSSGDQLLDHVQMTMHDVPKPQGDKQEIPQLLGLCAWGELGCLCYR